MSQSEFNDSARKRHLLGGSSKGSTATSPEGSTEIVVNFTRLMDRTTTLSADALRVLYSTLYNGGCFLAERVKAREEHPRAYGFTSFYPIKHELIGSGWVKETPEGNLLLTDWGFEVLA